MDLYTSIQSSTFECAKEALEFCCQKINHYGFNRIALSFNGGKDCTVLLELLRAACAHLNIDIRDLYIIYFIEEDEFNEIQNFMEETKQRYNLNFIELRGTFKDALNDLFKSQRFNPPLSAIFMGQRLSDPGCTNIEVVAPSDVDQGWPPFDRLNPLLRWSYSDIWKFIIQFHIPHCHLYKVGFTSIGNRLNSTPNPALYDKLTRTFRHASTLVDEQQERFGRKNYNSTAITRTTTISQNGVVSFNGISIIETWNDATSSPNSRRQLQQYPT